MNDDLDWEEDIIWEDGCDGCGRLDAHLFFSEEGDLLCPECYSEYMAEEEYS